MTRKLMLVAFICIGVATLYVGGPTACGGNACESSFDKVKACAAKLACDSLTDATAKATCEITKKLYANLDYAASKAACEKATPGKCNCDGAALTAAESINSCTLDEKTCACKTS